MISHVQANSTATAMLPIAKSPTKNTSTTSTGSSGSTSTTSSSTSSNTSSATTDIGSTFLNLLVQELQNQDPTAPMDSTAMVGQMISLNQLDQLISINQAVTGATSTGSTGTSGSTTTGALALTNSPSADVSSPGAQVALANSAPTKTSQPALQ